MCPSSPPPSRVAFLRPSVYLGPRSLTVDLDRAASRLVRLGHVLPERRLCSDLRSRGDAQQNRCPGGHTPTTGTYSLGQPVVILCRRVNVVCRNLRFYCEFAPPYHMHSVGSFVSILLRNLVSLCLGRRPEQSNTGTRWHTFHSHSGIQPAIQLLLILYTITSLHSFFHTDTTTFQCPSTLLVQCSLVDQHQLGRSRPAAQLGGSCRRSQSSDL